MCDITLSKIKLFFEYGPLVDFVGVLLLVFNDLTGQFCTKAYQIIYLYILFLPATSFPFLQGLSARVLGLWLIDLSEHHK